MPRRGEQNGFGNLHYKESGSKQQAAANRQQPQPQTPNATATADPAHSQQQTQPPASPLRSGLAVVQKLNQNYATPFFAFFMSA